jgi:hypothetical protein
MVLLIEISMFNFSMLIHFCYFSHFIHSFFLYQFIYLLVQYKYPFQDFSLIRQLNSLNKLHLSFLFIQFHQLSLSYLQNIKFTFFLFLNLKVTSSFFLTLFDSLILILLSLFFLFHLFLNQSLLFFHIIRVNLVVLNCSIYKLHYYKYLLLVISLILEFINYIIVFCLKYVAKHLNFVEYCGQLDQSF